MSRTNRATVTVSAELRRKLVSRQGSMEATGTSLGTGHAMTGGGALTGRGAMSAAGGAVAGGGALTGRGAMSAGGALAPTERRAVLTAAATAVLADGGWTVTVVHGDADHYTGIEATRGNEHLLAAVGADDLITDQAGAHDCTATLDAILSGLQADGAEVKVTNDVAHDGTGGSLYAIAGGPTRAHAIASTLRQGTSVGPGISTGASTSAGAAKPGGRHRRGPDRLRNPSGDR
jgi:hypothetical protein